MLTGMLVIIGMFTLAVASVQAAYLYGRFGQQENRQEQLAESYDNILHYVVICRESQQQIEGILRLLFGQAGWAGRPCQVTLLDQDSGDDTLIIVDRLARRYDIRIESVPEDLEATLQHPRFMNAMICRADAKFFNRV